VIFGSLLSSFQKEMKKLERMSQEASREPIDWGCWRMEDLDSDVETWADSDERFSEIKDYLQSLALWDRNSTRKTAYKPFTAVLSQEAVELMRDQYGVTEADFKWLHNQKMTERIGAIQAVRVREEIKLWLKRAKASIKEMVFESVEIFRVQQEIARRIDKSSGIAI